MGKQIVTQKIRQSIIVFLILSSFVITNGFVLATEGIGGGAASAGGSAKTSGEKAKSAGGLAAIKVSDQENTTFSFTNMIKNIGSWAMKFANDAKMAVWQKAGSTLYWGALGTALNNIAYDTATWVGSGGRGQKPKFITEGWGEYLTNVADNAAGKFIEDLGKEFGVNMCEPDLNVKLSIGLGLVQYQREEVDCSLSKMRKDWDSFVDSPQFFAGLQDMFNPTSNDLGIALEIQSRFFQEQIEAEETKKLERLANKGWLDVTNIAGRSESVPGDTERNVDDIVAGQRARLTQNTGDPFVDAANVFLNQLAITLLKRLLSSMGKGAQTYTSPYSGDYGGLSDYQGQADWGGIDAAKSKLRQIIQPKFSETGDFDIMGKLTSCPDPKNASTDNCVIDNSFADAVIKKITIGQAVKEGYIRGDGAFGFLRGQSLEPEYNQGFPYRSMIILRKYRIIPVGWEIAAEYIRENDLQRAITLNDMLNCYDPNDEYSGIEDEWCRGMVDPKWVLKAPRNYCRREGYGPNIISKQATGSGDFSQLMISRSGDYCADEQSCIKERDDGSCEYYGYCTEEKPSWNFQAESCQSEFNTCETFKSENGRTISYLKNTLDYASCGSNNAGCNAYARDGNYNIDSKSVVWNSNGGYSYFNRQVLKCDANDEGCSELIRTKPGLGVNLFQNGGFEAETDSENWSAFGTIVSTTGEESGWEGTRYLAVNRTIDKNFDVGPADFRIGGNKYVLSFYAKNCGDGVIRLGNAETALYDTAAWIKFQISHTYPTDDTGNKAHFLIEPGNLAGCQIDAMKLERSYAGTNYSAYGLKGYYYEKIIPPYLEAACYVSASDRRLKADADDICREFARKCNRDEEGCNLYASKDDDMAIPAKVAAGDYCAQECAGYDSFVQKETSFDFSHPDYFIPKTARNCSAAQIGCEEFTNLDELNKGAESTAYYSQLRQCVKLSDPDCADFYIWENTANSGFQIKTIKLKGVSSAGGLEPVTTEDTGEQCDADIFNKPASDPAYNPDCRQIYDTSGHISYKLFSKTVKCSDNCHPFRLTAKFENPANGEVECRGGGVWNEQHNACIYSAIPGDGVKCSAASVGCREYTGNTGNVAENIFLDDFEGGTPVVWTKSNDQSSAELSNESITNGGHSLKISGTVSRTFYFDIDDRSSYALSFIAKSAVGTANLKVSADFGNGSIETETIELNDAGWAVKYANLGNPGLENLASGKIIIESSREAFIDNVKLNEISNVYYKIRNTWNTPASCDRDQDGADHPQFAIGCKEYEDMDGQSHYLRGFSSLCHESAAGCELVIDTHNSMNPQAETIEGTVPVPADNYEYVIIDRDKACDSDQKGCRAFGEAKTYDSETVLTTVFVADNPDRYKDILCSSSAVGCDAWKSETDGVVYFKNPYNMACEWRKDSGKNDSWNWLKIKVKKCDANINGTIDGGTEKKICMKDSDCGLNADNEQIECIMDENDYSCPTTNYKTIGTGGIGNVVYQPDSGWAGICTAESSGCTEYIDPISRPSTNLLFNPNFERIANVENAGWANNEQSVEVKQFTLYVIEGKGAEVKCFNYAGGGSAIYLLNASNGLVSMDELIINESGSARFYTDQNVKCTIKNAGTAESVYLRPAIVSYRLNSDINYSSCNNALNPALGCVLFNERSYGSGNKPLIYDARIDSSTPQAGDNANRLIQVQPDRACAEWLACRSMAEIGTGEDKENACYDIGACDRINDSGQCVSFARSEEKDQAVDWTNISQYANLSGYSHAGNSDTDKGMLKAMYPTGAMSQTGESTEVPNGSFEFYDGNKYPTGWLPANNSTWKPSLFAVIDSPAEAQKFLIDYPREGKSIMRFSSEEEKSSPYTEFIDVEPDSKYIISADINTIDLKQKKTGDVSFALIVDFFNGAGDLAGSRAVISMPSGLKWQNKVGAIETLNGIRRIKIHLAAFTDNTICTKSAGGNDNCLGEIYIDNIKIRPALEVKDPDSGLYDKISQTCRLYPENDSLSCDYYGDSGVRYKGWPGYCLEYDRYPGSSDACLQWWPVDRVKGDGVEEGAGYRGAAPLYYCAEFTGGILVEARTIVGAGGSCDCRGYGDESEPVVSCEGKGCGTVPNGYQLIYNGGAENCGHDCPGGGLQNVRHTVFPTGSPRAVVNGIGWYDFDGDLQVINGDLNDYPGNVGSHDEASYGLKLYNPDDGLLYDAEVACSKILQVVTPSGQNKTWFSRTSEGSDYRTPLSDKEYETENAPFSSALPPHPVYNPYDWDGRQNSDNTSTKEPLFARPSSGTANSGAPYGCIGSQCGNFGLCSVDKTLCYHNISSLMTGNIRISNSTDLICPSNQSCSGSFSNYSTQVGLREIKDLFAQSYGAWQWNGSSYVGSNDDSLYWVPPSSQCPNNARPAWPNDYCGVRPSVGNILVNGNSGRSVNSVASDVVLRRNGYVSLSFASVVDANQLPLTMYSVDWGDGEKTIVSGVEMRDRQNQEAPHILYHVYDYWDLKNKEALGSISSGTCHDGYCEIKPKIKIKDNWGWCSNGVSGNPCPTGGANEYITYPGVIKVWER